MRAACFFWGIVVVGSGCLLEPTPVCCGSDFECVAGARCFEGVCALRCDDDGQCAEGELCVEPAGVCRAANRATELERCPFSDEEDRR